MNLELALQPKQGLAFMSRATEILYGGAAGGGKSHLIRVALIAWAQMIPGLQLGLFRRLYPDLRANHMEGPTSFPVLLAPLVHSGHARIVQNEITFSNGSRISLNHCQHEKDKYKYQGSEFHVLAFDELTHFTESIYRFLRGRLRMTGLNIPPHLKGLFPRIISGSNPGNVGHVWVKKTFVDPGPMGIRRSTKDEGAMLRQYIPARLDDNPTLLASDPTYEDRLDGLGDATLVRAMKEGDWKIVAGAMFGETWREERHVCAPFAIPIDWKIWRGADDGFEAPAACYWLTQDPTKKTIYVICEVYGKRMLPEAYAGRIARMDAAIMRWHGPDHMARNQDVIKGVLDSAAFSNTGASPTTRGEQINAELKRLKAGKFEPVEKWSGSRVHRAQNLHRLLAPNKKDPDGQGGFWPGIRFFNYCTMAIETIPALPRDKNDPEDVDTNADDHGYDGVTYGLQYAQNGFRRMRTAGT